MSNKVLFVTNFSVEKKKARLLFEQKILSDRGYQVDTLYFEGKYRVFALVLTYLSLKFFNFHQVFEVRKRAKYYDHIVIYGLQPLPAILFISGKKNVIYQSLDDNVSYTIYELSKRFKPFGWFSKPLDWFMRRVELALSSKARHILVNSLALKDYLEGSKLNYYTSPLENLSLTWNKLNPYALLYLGQLREEKGTKYIKEICERYSIPCHFFGMPVDDAARRLMEEQYIVFQGNKTAAELVSSISNLTRNVNLIGISMIESIHKSYETQEANKDIDYMAMGMPFVGNDRLTTKAKIEAGCGVKFDEFEQLLAFDFYSNCANRCRVVYDKDYKSELFIATFLQCFDTNHLTKEM